MNFMKRLIGMLLACTMILSMAGLSASAEEERVVRFLTVGDPYVGAIASLLPEFEAETGIKVIIDSIPYLDSHAKILLELTNGTGSYDCVSVDICWIGEFAQSGGLLDLTELVERDAEELDVENFLPGAWEALAVYEDQIIGLPLAPYYMYMHYRTDKFEELGLSVPATKDEFVEAVKAMYDPSSNFYGLTVALKRGASVVHDWAAYYNGFGGKIFKDIPNDYSAAINGEIGYETTKMFADLLAYLPSGVLQYENADRWNAFMHGMAGMVAVFNANSPQFETAEDSLVAGNVGYFAMPRLSEEDEESLPFGGFSIGINKDSRHIEDTWTFMKWLTSAETDKKWVQVPGEPGVPTRLSTVQDPELVEKYPYFEIIYNAEVQGLADGVNYRSRLPEWTQIEEVLGLQLNQAISGEKDIQQALDEAAAEINAIMKEAGYPVAD